MRDNYFTKILIEEYTSFIATKKNTNTNKEDILHFIVRILSKYEHILLWNNMTEFMKHIDDNRPLDFTNPDEMSTKTKKEIRKKRYDKK